METARNIAEITIGLVFAVGAAFSATYTRTHAREFYDGFATGAWLAPGRWFVTRFVLPNATVFNVGVFVLQVAIAGAILSRGGLVDTGLIA